MRVYSSLTGRILNTIIFSDTFSRITRVRDIAHPRNLGTLFIYYSSTIFQFLNSIYKMVRDFILYLRENLAYLRDVKTTDRPQQSVVAEQRKRKKLLSRVIV